MASQKCLPYISTSGWMNLTFRV